MPSIRTRLPTTKPRLGPGGSSAALYCATMPHIDHARMHVQQAEHRLLHGAADILEIDVDALRAGLDQGLGAGWRSGDRRSRRSRASPAPTGTCPARRQRPPPAQPAALGKLARDRAHRPGGGRDHHRLARLGLADVLHARIGGRARHAEHAEPGPERRGVALHLGQRRRRRERCASASRGRPPPCRPRRKPGSPLAITSPTVSPVITSPICTGGA